MIAGRCRTAKALLHDKRLAWRDYVLGAADVWVSNISPHLNTFRGDDPGGVRFILHADWDSPLDVAMTITAGDALPVGIQGYT